MYGGLVQQGNTKGPRQVSISDGTEIVARKPKPVLRMPPFEIEKNLHRDNRKRKMQDSLTVEYKDEHATTRRKMEEETRLLELKRKKESMLASLVGRASPFVREVLAIECESGIFPVTSDNLGFLVKRMLETQEQFRQESKPTVVSIGYHYTHATNLGLIQCHGLLSRPERAANSIHPSRFTGAAYGEGIYTAADASPFHNKYGDTCIMVGRLKGECSIAPRGQTYECGNNSVTKLYPSGQEHLTVLQKSSQCLPLMQFPTSMIVAFSPHHPGNKAVMALHQKLQSLIDRFFNDSIPTPIAFFARPEKIEYVAPASLPWVALDSVAWIVRQGTYSDLCRNCVICSEPLMRSCNNGKVVRLHVCGHQYHANCIHRAIHTRSHCCPTCQKEITEPRGTSPSGSMTIAYSLNNLSRDDTCGSIVIRYSIPASTQQEYHAHPGRPHGSTHREAYLPNTQDGHNLLLRLKWAFAHGFTFTVGTSATTGRSDCVIWASIRHKTSTHGGLCGFPDPDFFQQCNSELDALRVPPAKDL